MHDNEEDINSVNNMRINSFYIDLLLEQEKKHPQLLKIKQTILRMFRFLKHIICVGRYGIRKTLILLKADVNPKVLQNYNVLQGFDHDYELNYIFRNSRVADGKIVVYTAIFGNYDEIKEPLYVSDNCEYYIITDKDVPKNSIWKKLDYKDERFMQLDNYHKSKFCKIHPHVLFPNHEYSLWVDGNAQIVADVMPLIDRLSEEHCMASFRNPLHNDIFTEAVFLVYHDAADMDELNKQLNKYKSEGFPKSFGMREFSIIVRRHHNDELVELSKEWWKELNTYTMRDQISFPYILWKHGLSIDYIDLLGDNWRYNPRFIYTPHNYRISYKR